MDIPLSWLKQYVPVTIPARELAHRLTMAGTEVGAVRQTGADWDREKILVGQVLKVDPHPNADRLTLPTVDLGGESATVVCGAPNVAAGQKIAFAKEGARLVSARSGKVEPLKAAKIRGVLSAGMVCSERELGLGDDHAGIVVLDDNAPVGTPLADYLGDAVLELELTPNRPDCLSVLGVAHEVAAITGETVTEPDASYPEEGGPIDESARVEIADVDLCPRYAASLVTGVAVGLSPKWLHDALVKAGQRPINNVVDVTNYVMLEYGQPLHAFAFEKVKEATIIVRAARPGERLTTLDGESRTLQPPMLTIADSRDAVALAGVMGGADTEVRDDTTAILLESANFDAINSRRTAAALRLGTEASYRFERGIRADLVPRALRRATQLLLQVAGGKAAKGIIDEFPGRTDPPPVKITSDRIRKVLGVELDMAEVERVLTSLGFGLADGPQDGGVLWTIAPYWRSDIAIEEDLIEEVARIVGYDNVPTTPLSTPIPHRSVEPLRQLTDRVKDLLSALGLQEVISYPLTDAASLEAVGASEETQPLEIANPVNSEARLMRTSLRASLLSTLEANRRVSREEGIRIFEVGRVYLARPEAKDKDLPDEKEVLVGLLSGPRHGPSWLSQSLKMDFFDAKGAVDSLLEGLHLAAEYQPDDGPVFHPGKSARILVGGNAIGSVGEVHPRVLTHFGLDGEAVAMLEIDLEDLQAALPKSPEVYRSATRFPGSERDLALNVNSTVPSAAIQRIIERNKLVASTIPFDVYTGAGVPAGKRSIAYRVVFQSDRSTLTTEQVDRAQESILRQLQRELGAELRD